jgi:hypothetical protein
MKLLLIKARKGMLAKNYEKSEKLISIRGDGVEIYGFLLLSEIAKGRQS